MCDKKRTKIKRVVCLIVVFLIFVILLLPLGLIILVLSNIDRKGERLFSEDGLVIRTFSDSDALIILRIKEKSGMHLINTRASCFSRFDVNILTKEKFVFLSSDIGNCMYMKQRYNWCRYDVDIFLSPDQSFVTYLVELKTSLSNSNILSGYCFVIYSIREKRVIFSKEFSLKRSAPFFDGCWKLQ